MNRKRNSQTGFTIIELMVALVIASIMMVFALPAFNDFVQQRRMAANVNLLVAGITYARSEATRLGATVTLQTLDSTDNDNEWGPGFCVTAGDPGNCNAALRTFTLEGTGTFDGMGGFQNGDALSFNSRGLLQGGVAGFMELCGEDADDDPGRVVNINAIGRPSVVPMTCFP